MIPNAILRDRAVPSGRVRGGFKFHSPQENWDRTPTYWQMYRTCEHLGLVMLFHTGVSSRSISDQPNIASSIRMRPGYLETIARMCPKAIIQGAHFGNPWVR